MGKVGDGVKMGMGIWLFFKVLLPLGFLMILVIAGTCLFGIHECGEKKWAEDKAAVAASSPVGESVMYRDTCNIRSRPSARGKKLGQVESFKAYPVLESKGKWKQIEYAPGMKGWCGCKDQK